MKIKVLDLQMGDRIVAYCSNKRQTCTVKHVEDDGQINVTLTVSISGHYRSSVSRAVLFRRDALVDLAT
jgi:hypothetical protein